MYAHLIQYACEPSDFGLQQSCPSGRPVGCGRRTRPFGHGQPNSNWKTDVDKRDGNGNKAALVFVRNADGVRVYVPPSVDSNTITVMFINKLTSILCVV